jgi:hypothetical protein
MRKLIGSMLFMAVMSMSLMTSCKDDDKDADVSGTYSGTLTATVLGENYNSASTAVLSKSGSNYTLNLRNLSIALSIYGLNIEIPIGDVQITDLVATSGALSGGKEVTINVTLPLALQAVTGQANVDVKVSFTRGSVAENNLSFELAIKDVPVVSTVPVTFAGTK